MSPDAARALHSGLAMQIVLHRATMAIVLAAMTVSCQKSDGSTRTGSEPRTSSTTPPAGAETARQTATVKTRMSEHFSKATEAKTAVVRAELDRARLAASSLAESEWTPHLRPDWRPYMHTMQEAARSVAHAADNGQASQGIGRIGEACASCHVAVGGPKLAVQEPPDARSHAEFQPMLHVWAVDRMWEGLIGPSQESWRRGAAILVDAPFEPAVRIATREVPPEVTVLANRVHELGRRARMVDVDRRGAVLGDVLTTCATCHEELHISLP